MSVLFLVLPLGENASRTGRGTNPVRATNKYQTPPIPSFLSFPFSFFSVLPFFMLKRERGKIQEPSWLLLSLSICPRPASLSAPWTKSGSWGFLPRLLLRQGGSGSGVWQGGEERGVGSGALKERCKPRRFWEAISPVYCRWITAPWLVNHWSIWHVRAVENDSPKVWSLENRFFSPLPRKLGIASGFVGVPPPFQGNRQSQRQTGRMEGWRGINLKTQLVRGEQFPPAACPRLLLVTYIWGVATSHREGRRSRAEGMWLLTTYCTSARKLQNASCLACEPLGPHWKVQQRSSPSAFAFHFLQMYFSK